MSNNSFSLFDFSLPSDHQIKGYNSDVLKKIGPYAKITDYAMLQNRDKSRSRTKRHIDFVNVGSEYIRTCNYYLEPPDEKELYRIIPYHKLFTTNNQINKIDILDIDERSVGIRPTLLYYNNFDKLLSNGAKIISKPDDEIIEVEYGEYPQDLASNEIQIEVENEEKNGTLKKIGTGYTYDSGTYIWDYGIDESKFIEAKSDVYEYKGEKYIKVVNRYNDCFIFSDSSRKMCKTDESVWIKISPLKWYKDEKNNMLISEKIVASGIKFYNALDPHNSKTYRHNYKTSSMYEFLNNYFANDILPLSYQKSLTKKSNNSNKSNKSNKSNNSNKSNKSNNVNNSNGSIKSEDKEDKSLKNQNEEKIDDKREEKEQNVQESCEQEVNKEQEVKPKTNSNQITNKPTKVKIPSLSEQVIETKTINSNYQTQSTDKENPYSLDFKKVSEEEIIKGAIESGVAVFLHGPSSEGKSARVKKIDPDCVIIYLRNATPESLNGKSVYNAEKGEMIDIKPTWLKKLEDVCNNEPDKLHIVFFDEITNALPSIQGIAFNIVLDREVNGIWKLPDNARIVAAGNEMKDSLSANQLAEPLFNRFAHVYISTTPQGWLKWASENNIHPAICAYIAYTNGKSLRSKYTGEKPNADPRKWEMASKMLYQTGCPEMIRSLVGEDITNEFVAFCKQKVLTLEDVIKGNYNMREIQGLDTSSKYLLTTTLSQVDENNFYKVREFVSQLGPEFLATFESLWAQGDENRLGKIAEIRYKDQYRAPYRSRSSWI